MDTTALDHQVHLRALATALERVCNANVDLRGTTPTVFDAVSVPAMTIHCYLVRMHRYTKFDFVCFHVATWYLHRLGLQDPCFCPTVHNIHRLLVAALLVASKATDDIFHANLFMAQCGGIGCNELNKLEVELCERLRWHLLPTTGDMRELIDALHNPQAPFWDAWRNAPRSPPSVDVDGLASEGAERESVTAAARLPHAKSMQHSLARFFSSSHAVTGSEGNLEALASAPPTARGGAGLSAGKAAAAAGEGDATGLKGGSPRSVMGGRTFSLSNLFGLGSGW